MLRGALQATQAKSLVVDEPEAVVFGQQGSWQPSYNVQLAVDAEAQIIVDAEAVANPSDNGQLAPGAERVAAVLEIQPTAEDGDQPAVTLLADAGYSSAQDATVRGRGDPAPRTPQRRLRATGLGLRGGAGDLHGQPTRCFLRPHRLRLRRRQRPPDLPGR